MSDPTGPNGSQSDSPRTSATPSRPLATPGPGDARIAPELKSLGEDLTRELDNGDGTPKDVGPSLVGDVSSEKAATMAKAKSTTSRSTAARAAPKPAAKATPRSAAARPAPSRAAPAMDPDDSILLAGLDRAELEAERLRRWAAVRRQEAKQAIQSHPLGSSVMVFAAGMIFGLLMARR